MYPNEIFLGLTLYEIMIAVGVLICLVVFRFYITERHMPNKVFNFYLITAVASFVVGFFFAAVFQSLFTLIKTGKTVFLGDGVTFYGGLFGGVCAFFLITFTVGKLFFKNDEHIKYLNVVAAVAPCSVTVAHAFGRIGCLFAGCCHGAVTDSPIGIRMWIDELQGYYNAVPLQLFEAIFLFVLFGVCSFLFFKNLHYELETYCIGYGVWRFIIEFFRTDDRGSFFIRFLTPSQGFAILFIAVGVLIIIFKLRLKVVNGKRAE